MTSKMFYLVPQIKKPIISMKQLYLLYKDHEFVPDLIIPVRKNPNYTIDIIITPI